MSTKVYIRQSEFRNSKNKVNDALARAFPSSQCLPVDAVKNRKPLQTNEYYARLDNVTESPEKRFNGCFTFVFVLTGEWQVKRMPRCIYQRVISTVLSDFGNPDMLKTGPKKLINIT